jgi:hypothetical protein
LESNEEPEVENKTLKRKPEGIFFLFHLLIHLSAELDVGGRPQKSIKQGLSEKTLTRRYEALDDLVDGAGMHLID